MGQLCYFLFKIWTSKHVHLCVYVSLCEYHAWGRRAGTWSAVGFQAGGPPVGRASRVCRPASSDRTVGSGSSAERLHASQTFPLSGPSRDRNWTTNLDVKHKNRPRKPTCKTSGDRILLFHYILMFLPFCDYVVLYNMGNVQNMCLCYAQV